MPSFKSPPRFLWQDVIGDTSHDLRQGPLHGSHGSVACFLGPNTWLAFSQCVPPALTPALCWMLKGPGPNLGHSLPQPPSWLTMSYIPFKSYPGFRSSSV